MRQEQIQYDERIKTNKLKHNDLKKQVKKLLDDHYLWKRLNEDRDQEIRTLKHEIRELDHRYKKQMCLMKTDLPMQTTQVAHALIVDCFQD